MSSPAVPVPWASSGVPDRWVPVREAADKQESRSPGHSSELYGLFTDAVAVRERASLVHIALDAARADVAWMTVRPALVPGILGVIVGAIGVPVRFQELEPELEPEPEAGTNRNQIFSLTPSEMFCRVSPIRLSFPSFTARSPIETMPTRRSFSTTGRRRI